MEKETLMAWDNEFVRYLIVTLLVPIITLLTQIIAPIVAPKLFRSKREREIEEQSLDAKTEFDISQSATAIANGSKVAIENVLRTVEVMKMEIESHKELRILRDKEILELKEQIQKDIVETRRIRNEYALSQARIIALEELIIKAGEYLNVMKTAMQEAKIDLPLNGELMRRISNLKMEIAQRNK